MSFFPIPADKFGTKTKKTKLTKEIKHSQKSKTRKAHTIKDVRDKRKKTDQYAANRILNLENLIKKYDLNVESMIGISRLAALATLDDIFDNAFEAKCFILSHKNYLY